MDETVPDDLVTVGQRLREAREAKGLSVEDIAAQTRIPTRHLTSLEESDWDKLPAATYSIGFAKNYAGALGLDRTEIGDQLRAEMGGTRLPTAHLEVYEAVDPARTMPKGLVMGALGLLVVVVLALSWLSNRSMQADQPVAEADNAAPPAASTATAAPTPPSAPTAAVVITATEPVWLHIEDGGNVLKEGQLAAGERFEVPAKAVAPMLTTGKPEALQVSVGTTQAPPVGPAGRKVSNVSLKAADLMRTPANTAAAAAPSRPVQAPPAPRPASRRSIPQVAPPATGSATPSQPAEANAADAATVQ
jgi:transcriptional regulator with XRE-family HTH domain